MPKEVDVFIYLTDEEVEQALRQYLTKKGHGSRVAGLTLSPIETAFEDDAFQTCWRSGKRV